MNAPGGPGWIIDQAMRTAAALARRLGVATPLDGHVVFAMAIAIESLNGDPGTIAVQARNPFLLLDPDCKRRWRGFDQSECLQIAGVSYARFDTDAGGAEAAAAHLMYGDPDGYRPVLQAFVVGDVLATAHALQSSTFSPDHFGGQLVPAVAAALAHRAVPVDPLPEEV